MEIFYCRSQSHRLGMISLGKIMLTVSSYVLVLCASSIVLQEGSLYDFRTDWSEADKPVTPELNLLASSQCQCNICLPLTFSHLLDLSEIETSLERIFQLSQHLWMQPVEPNEPIRIKFLQVFTSSAFVCCWSFSSSLNPFQGRLGEGEAKKT